MQSTLYVRIFCKLSQISINKREIKLHGTIKDVIKNSMNDVSFTMQTSTTLKFENYWDLNLFKAEFVAIDEIEELEENNKNEEEDSCTLEENEFINNDYKRKAVKFWKSEKKAHYFLSTVQHRFKKVKSLPQLSMGTFSTKRWYSYRKTIINF